MSGYEANINSLANNSHRSYVITIHKSQGQTLTKAVNDLGKAELAAGCTFVAISRLKTLQDGLFQPMMYERLQAIGCTKRLIERKAEETRLRHLALQTMSHMLHTLWPQLSSSQGSCTCSTQGASPPVFESGCALSGLGLRAHLKQYWVCQKKNHQ